MKNKNWLNIIQLNEFNNCFNIEELVELGLCCKSFRFKLIPFIYKSLNINNRKIKKFGYKGHKICEVNNEYNEKNIQRKLKELVHYYKQENNHHREEGFTYPINFFINPYKHLTREYIKSKDKFQSDLKLIPHKPSILYINYLDEYCYLIQELSTPFNNLKALYIKHITVTMEDLQYLLDNLKCLDDLQFINNYLLKCKLETVGSYINWPQNLKKLSIGSNLEILLENNYDPIHVQPFDGSLDIPSTYHLLLPNQLHNLESLSLKPFNFVVEEEFDKLAFLRVNSHITKLSFPFEIITQLFDIISSFQNLEHLCIFSTYGGIPIAIDNIESSIPSNLKSVSLNLNEYMEVINFLNKSFLQITCLTVKLKSIQFPDLCKFISKLPAMDLLKSLKLCFKLEVTPGIDIDKLLLTNIIKFPRLNLECVVFKFEKIYDDFYDDKIDLNQLKLRVDECLKLKYIEFKSDNDLNFFGKVGLDNLEVGSDWKLISTPRKCLLYKNIDK